MTHVVEMFMIFTYLYNRLSLSGKDDLFIQVWANGFEDIILTRINLNFYDKTHNTTKLVAQHDLLACADSITTFTLYRLNSPVFKLENSINLNLVGTLSLLA